MSKIRKLQKCVHFDDHWSFKLKVMNCVNWFSTENPREYFSSITKQSELTMRKTPFYVIREEQKTASKNSDECKVKLTYLKHLNMLLKAMWVKWLLIYSISPYKHTHTHPPCPYYFKGKKIFLHLLLLLVENGSNMPFHWNTRWSGFTLM